MELNYVFRRGLSEIDLAPYDALAVVFACSDDRFVPTVQGFLASKGVGWDRVFIAGGAKVLASPEPFPIIPSFLMRLFRVSVTERHAAFFQIGRSVLQHKTRKVMLFNHIDCKEYPYQSDPEQEIIFHTQELRKAHAVVEAAYSTLVIELYLIDAKGVISIPVHK